MLKLTIKIDHDNIILLASLVYFLQLEIEVKTGWTNYQLLKPGIEEDLAYQVIRGSEAGYKHLTLALDRILDTQPDGGDSMTQLIDVAIAEASKLP